MSNDPASFLYGHAGLEMEELYCAYYAANRDTNADFELMFSMAGPRRRGDLGQLTMNMSRFPLRIECRQGSYHCTALNGELMAPARHSY
jgi:hypothetical protein